MYEFELTDEEIMRTTGYYYNDTTHWAHQVCVKTGCAAQKKLITYLDLHFKISQPERTIGQLLGSISWNELCQSLGIVGYEKEGLTENDKRSNKDGISA